MDVYRRYASREHDKRHFTRELAPGHIKVRPLSSSFDSSEPAESTIKSVEFWKGVFENAAFFCGNDPLLFGPVLTVVFKNSSTDKLCALSITKFGANVYENLMLDSGSRFWPACQNLPESLRKSNVRRALAVTNLKNYNKLWNNKGLVDVTQHWDETNAGNLAAKMQLVDSLPSKELGNRILAMGILQELMIPSFVVDVLYNNSAEEVDEQTIEENNKLVVCLGEQLDLLFDPLLEYSPQAMDIEYQVPANPKKPALSGNMKVEQVIDELIAVQTNYTNDLVGLLQNFIIPLRVSVLASPSNSGMMKVNLAFPPTIDEVTRVNCIVHFLLNEAKGYGYVEVFKVLGSFLHFFYKAFIRHQANLSNFNARFDKFVENNFSYAFESPTINIGKFAPRAIKAIIVDSVLELPRLKLIIKRLYETIKEEKIKLKISKSARDDEDAEIDAYFSSAMAVIDSFGFQEAETDSKARVFTPSGKLLTEWATEWPSELQYGWISRKVVGIYNLANTKSTSENENEIAIVFSDHILFLEMQEPYDNETAHILPDILMNSLINQKPLPKLSTLPKLRVKYWCPITNLIVKTFQSEDGYCLNFTTISGNRLKNKDETSILFTENYRIYQVTDSFSACNRIIDIISKAQVLCKSTPFHLFKYDEGDLQRYFCAHEYDTYNEEVSKSPIALFLNMDEDKVTSVLQHNPLIYFVLSVSSVNDYTVSLVGRDRHETLRIEEIVSLDDLKNSLKEIVFKAMNAMFRSSYFSKVITEGNLSLISHFILECCDNHNEQHNLLSDALPRIRGDGMPIKNSIEENSPREKEFESNEAQSQKNEYEKGKSVRISGRKSGIFRIFEKLKHKHGHKESHVSKETQREKKKSMSTIPNTYIPKGKKTVYKNLYKPEPVLREASAASSVQNPEAKVSTRPEHAVLYPKPVEAIVEENQGEMIISASKRSEEIDVPYSIEDIKYPTTRNSSNGTRSSSNYNDSLSLEQFLTANKSHNDTVDDEDDVLRNQSETQLHEPSHSNSVNTTLYNPVDDAQTLVTGLDEPIARKVADNITAPAEYLASQNSEQLPKDVSSASRVSLIAPTSIREMEPKPVPAPFLKIYPLESPEEKPIVPPHKVTSLFEKKPAGKRQISGQDIATALDNINAIGVLPDVHDRYKMYDMIPNSVFSADGMSNWTSVLTESSSNLQAEIRAMKEEAHMDTEDVIDYNPTTAELFASHANTSAGTAMTENFSIVNASRFEQVPVKTFAELRQIQRDESTQSLTPEQLAREFGSQLDQEFDLDSDELDRSISTLSCGKFDPIYFKPNEREKTLFHSLDFSDMNFDSLSDHSGETQTVNMVENSRALGQKRQLLTSTPSIVVFEPLQPTDTSTTDEEYFLSSDIMGLNYYLSENIITGAPSSPSSEKTLQNEVNYIEKSDTLFDEQWRTDSVAYLSRILRGEIDI